MRCCSVCIKGGTIAVGWNRINCFPMVFRIAIEFISEVKLMVQFQPFAAIKSVNCKIVETVETDLIYCT